MKVEEKQKQLPFPQKMEKTVFLCLSSSPQKSWNVTSLENVNGTKWPSEHFALILYFITHFMDAITTEHTHLCQNTALHYLYTNSNNVNKYNKHEKIVFFIISVSSKFFFPTSKLCYLCSEDYLNIMVEGSYQSVGFPTMVCATGNMLVPEIKKAQK